ncbi:MAG: DUF523 domain-containing protein [Thermodesulfobacteriota bacterium]
MPPGPRCPLQRWTQQRDPFITDTLSQYVEFFPACPELECGLPVPREAMRLVGDPESPRLITSNTKQDHTERMMKWRSRRVRELEELNLYGFIFKKGAPSSAMERVRAIPTKACPPIGTSVCLTGRSWNTFPCLESKGRQAQ